MPLPYWKDSSTRSFLNLGIARMSARVLLAFLCRGLLAEPDDRADACPDNFAELRKLPYHQPGYKQQPYCLYPGVQW
jgi:hypothetical protein